MKYRVLIARAAERELDRLPEAVRRRIASRILDLENDSRPPGTKKLREREEYRLRIGSYRVVYEVGDTSRVVVVTAVRHRREAYRP